jgi:hypothetical protein
MKKLASGLFVAIGAVSRGVPTVLRDGAGLAGAAAIAYGLYMISPPYGYIGGGILLLAGATLTALPKS